ncbi:hypothetical protein L3Q82_026843 [Scortum barcoo]|uniref:Uncharacterized protein n=1 Tax=Scortum barcoo TaxID=214431 RepID=A0ACB8WMV8_9TELE|nr:hypothetical protein L3Q82_026843 [Scortum barcoo]
MMPAASRCDTGTALLRTKRLQSVVRTAERIVRAPLPSLQHIYHRRVHRKACSIIKDPSHPQHTLFSLLPSGRKYRSEEQDLQAEVQFLSTSHKTHQQKLSTYLFCTKLSCILFTVYIICLHYDVELSTYQCKIYELNKNVPLERDCSW